MPQQPIAGNPMCFYRRLCEQTISISDFGFVGAHPSGETLGTRRSLMVIEGQPESHVTGRAVGSVA